MTRQTSFLLMIFTLLFGIFAFGADPMPPADFFAMVLDYIKSFGGVPWLLKLSGLITLIIASMKVSFLKDLLWNKLGDFKTWLAPILGIVFGIVSLATSGQLTL